MAQKYACIPMFTAVLFTTAMSEKQSKCPLTENKQGTCGADIQWDVTQPLKQMKLWLRW